MKKQSTKAYSEHGYFNTLTGQEETTTANDGGIHSNFIDISKTSNSYPSKKYVNKKYNISSNTTISEYDCCYDSNNNIFNQGFNSYNGFGKNQLSSNSTPCNNYYNINTSSAGLMNHDTYSSQKTVGTQDSQQPNQSYMSLNALKNGSTTNISNVPNISVQNLTTTPIESSPNAATPTSLHNNSVNMINPNNNNNYYLDINNNNVNSISQLSMNNNINTSENDKSPK
ncbi:hypothetical protein PIROE2DRAFT_67661 [Piromyces sp. E2]|nr:hypothetical protein PIROE2DRAFT_67661 [Piromyces sp. E2]|eukprot:OUM59627.1 hypothetical protein PIROE2DRAFT_67661 [Piromyces sp. E2]